MKNDQPVSLHVLVNRIMKSLQPASVSTRNRIVNDIPLSLMVTPDEQTIATLFNLLLQAALGQSGNNGQKSSFSFATGSGSAYQEVIVTTR